MAASSSPWPLTEPPPPGELDLPYDDGEPMDTPRHRQQMNLLITSPELAWYDRDDFFAGGNMFVYFDLSQTVKNDFRGPDVFVVLDTTRRERRSWVVWGEDGRTPTVVIELTSPSTEAVDRGQKMEIYAKRLHVPVYVLFDPWTARLDGFELDVARGEYRPITPLPNGDLPCTPLGLSLGPREGTYEGVEARWLPWIDRDGKALPTDHQVAQEERRRAELERNRAEAERQLAEQLASRLAEYENRYGALE